MKLFQAALVTTVVLALNGGVNGLANHPKIEKTTTSRRQLLFQGIAVATGGIATVMLPNNQAAHAEFDPATFNHFYNDPKHPNCKRIVQVKQDGFVQLSGTDGNPGCPEDGEGTVWRLQGELRDNTILVDFRPKVRIRTP